MKNDYLILGLLALCIVFIVIAIKKTKEKIRMYDEIYEMKCKLNQKRILSDLDDYLLKKAYNNEMKILLGVLEKVAKMETDESIISYVSV